MAAFRELTLLVKQEGGRYFLDWGIETDSQEACVHGIKRRWVCDECAELYEQAADTKEQNSDSPASPVQQLKAEIAALANELEEHCKNRSYVLLDRFIERMRQLSAV